MKLRQAVATTASVLLAQTLIVAATDARANGRFPSAEQLVVEPGNPSHIAVQTTYGFLHTRDDGNVWTWSCEEAAGYGGILDPPIGLFAGGRLLGGVFDGLLVSSTDHCDYALMEGDLEGRFFVDVSVFKQSPQKAIGISSNGLGNNLFDTRIFATSDSGDTWALLGTPLPSDFLALTADVAPSNEQRIYVSGFTIVSSDSYVGSLARSDDAGLTWTVIPVPGSDNLHGPFLGAVHPTNPDRVYLRLSGDTGTLLVSDDAGQTMTPLHTTSSPMLGFALSGDGSQLRVGSELDGVWGASTSDHVFSKLNDVGVRCLTFDGARLYVCAREAKAGYTIARSEDGGQTFTPIHTLACLSGPDPACGANTSIGESCIARWAAQRQILQTDQCEGTGGAGGATTSGGTDDGGDGCCSVAAPRAPQDTNQPLSWSWLALGAGCGAVLLRARRRRR